MEDLNYGITMAERVMAINQAEVTCIDRDDLFLKRALTLTNLVNLLLKRFSQTAFMDDLEHAIVAGENCLSLVPISHHKYALCQYNLGRTLKHLFDLAGSIDDLNHAISLYEQACSVTLNNAPDRAVYLDGFVLLC